MHQAPELGMQVLPAYLALIPLLLAIRRAGGLHPPSASAS
jgi:hypothetical protein